MTPDSSLSLTSNLTLAFIKEEFKDNCVELKKL